MPLNLPKRSSLFRVSLILFSCFLICGIASSQTLNWAFKAGGTGRDETAFVHVDNAGDVLVTGLFSGTTDFDPSAATFNLTSAGSEDIFVAKYTSAGQFLWAFSVGGSNRDWGLSVTSDINNNVIVTGFFRGSNIDFDPSAATANLTSNGDAGGDPGYGGDIFLAKYNSAGQYQWAFNIGGSELYDSGIAVVTDGSSNIYLGGYFKETVDFDPSPAVSNLNSATGTIFLSKYTSAGNYQWAFNTGLGNNDNAIFDLKADNNGNVYVAGYFQGTNIDFDPSASTALLSSNGGFEIFFAKYTTNGQYVFAHSIGGSGIDVARGIDIDNNGNIYLIGDFTGSNIDFNPGAGTAPLTSNGGTDVFLAKYTNTGNYVWAFNFGAGASDIGWKLSTDNAHLFVTGGFTGTTDMNPSPTITDNLVSNGGNDIFLGKYNLNGEYLCAFNIGGSQDDYGAAIRTAGTNNFYLGGYFRGINVDFDPTVSAFNLSSNGNSDAFLSKFTWPDNTQPAGTLTGMNICQGGTAKLTFNATAGTGPFTIVYNNGSTNVTVNNVQSGVPFNVTPNPTTTTTYTLVSIRDAQRCSETAPASGTAVIRVDNCQIECSFWPVFGIGNYTSPIPYGNNVSFSFSNPGNMTANSAYSTMTPGNWFTPDPTIATLSPPNTTAHNPSDIGAIAIFPTVVNNIGTISFASPTTTGFYLHIWQTVSRLDFDQSFTLVSSDGDLHVGNSGALTNNVIIPDVIPHQSPDDANATIYFPPGISQIRFTITAAPPPAVSSDGIKLAFTFPDECFTPDTTIINDYTPVLSLDPCKNIINVGDASAFNVGDTVLLIQMKGAVVDSSNTASFGNITSYNNAGNYEFNYIKAKTGNSIELLNVIERQYDLINGKVQLITVPYFQNYTTTATSTLSCLPWDGTIGGVLVFNVQNNLTLNGNIDVSGRGFYGGLGYNGGQLVTNCFTNGFYYPATNGNIAGIKGESIATISNSKIRGKGALAGAGGSGLDHNSGGGGGGNGGAGGFGGYQLEPCGNAPFDNRGIGGRNISYSNAANKIFMGSGGGAGHANNPANVNYPSSGGNGGGIVIISAQSLQSNTSKIISNGANAPGCNFAVTNDCHDAMGGGGSGGTILLNITNYIGTHNVEVKGGRGADMTGPVPIAGRIGSGGGGGGGVTWLRTPSLPANITINSAGGLNGVLITDANNAWGATAGSNGVNLFSLQLPVDDVLFKPNIDSLRIKDSILNCNSFDFKGLAYTNRDPITNWQWDFGDGGAANTQNVTHTYATAGSFTVKLVITDINGCKDSITTNVLASLVTVNAGNDTTICRGQSVLMQASTTGGVQFQWSNGSLLNNNSILNPTATPTASTTTFVITATNSAGCSVSDTVAISLRRQTIFSVNSPSPVCLNDSARLIATGGDIYSWSPATSLTDPNISNPIASPLTSTNYQVTITESVCNESTTLTVPVTVLPLPIIDATRSNDIDCTYDFADLNATGGRTYSWTPAATLDRPTVRNPRARPTVTTQYIVKGTDNNGCSNIDSVIVKADFTGKGIFMMPNAFTPNNDGLNDCFRIPLWGVLEEVEFNIYNRWGELVFHTTDVTKCWDGKWKGREQNAGVFVYWVRAKSKCEGTVFRKGTVVLIR